MWLDIALIAIVVIFSLVGLAKGFIDSVLSIFSSVVSIIAAYFLAKYVVAFLDKTVSINSFVEKLLGKCGVKEAGFAGFGREKLATVVAFVACVLLVWLLIKLVLWLLSRLFSSVTSNSSSISSINRLLGFVFGAAKGLLVVAVALSLTSLISNMANVTKIDNYIKDTKITKYCHNYVSDWTAKNVQDWVDELVDKMTDDDNTEESGSGEAEGESTSTFVIDDVEYVCTLGNN